MTAGSSKRRKKHKAPRRGKVPTAKTGQGGKARVDRTDVSVDELKSIVDQLKSGQPVSDEDCGKLYGAVDTLAVLTAELEAKGASIRRLRRLIFGPSSEKSRDVLGRQGGNRGAPPTGGTESDSAGTPDQGTSNQEGTSTGASDDQTPASEQPSGSGDTTEQTGQEGAPKGDSDGKPPKAPGHGRNSADDYHGAEKITVPHGQLKHKDRCPACAKGKVYRQSQPRVLVRVTGVAPLNATVYELERLRCNLCGEIFTADSPEHVGARKFDEPAAVMIALLKYGCGMPFNRLERLEGNLGIPLPASTQWEVVEPAADKLTPVYQELVKQAAQGTVLHNDDTTARILNLEPWAPGQDELDESGGGKKERTGLFTSGIVSVTQGQRVALFFTGRQHAGENLEDVLRQRAGDLNPPIQMSDCLPVNRPGDQPTIRGGCNSHARRRFVDVVESFPQEVEFVLDVFKGVYANDDWTKEQAMSPAQRLAYHQQHSAPLMTSLETWLKKQLEEKKVEPNSSLGAAIKYMQRHWTKLTLFLREPGAPLDNNLCERALKKVILHRKNALFFKTPNGARVGDLFMSLIHTCELGGVNPFDYLTTLLQHHRAVSAEPTRWLPWNYQATLAELQTCPEH